MNCIICGKALTEKQAYAFAISKKKKPQKTGPYCSQSCCCKDPVVQAKKKKACLQKYGCQNPSQCEAIKRKKEETSMKHYGTKYPCQNKQQKKRRQAVVFQHYGVKNPSQAQEVKEKKKQKALQVYGVENVFQSPEIKQKMKRTIKQKYGVDNINQRLQQREKSYASMVARNIHCTPMFEVSQWKGTGVSSKYPVRCVTCGQIYTAKSKSDYLSICPKCKQACTSMKEKLLAKFIKQNCDLQIETANRSVLRRCGLKNTAMEIDIYIPQLKVGFQFNGTFWHKEGQRKTPGYHKKKTMLCKQRGVNLYHIWEKDWDERRPLVEKAVKNILKRGY